MKQLELFDLGMYSLPDGDIETVDRELILNQSVLKTLEARGKKVGRYDMITSPRVFVSNKLVSNMLQMGGSDAFPLLIADGNVVLSGRYPTVEEWSEFSEEPSLAGNLIPLTEEEVSLVTGGSSCSTTSESSCATCGGCSSVFR